MNVNTNLHSNLSFDEFDELRNSRVEDCEFDNIVETAISRRGFMNVVAYGTGAFLLGAKGLIPTSALAADDFSFEQIPANSLDTVTVPPGYNWHVVAKWGDPMSRSGIPFDQITRGTGESQENSIGDNFDGMALFNVNGRNLFVVNNEYTNRDIIYGNRASKLPETDDDVRKGKAAHGITIVELRRVNRKWTIDLDSEFNRRITADSPMELTGPASGHALLKTAADPTGTASLGTWNNCGNGRTPWGTYLACEENFNGYFSSSNSEFQLTPEFERYGIGHEDWGYGWGKTDERFDISKHPNEPNRAGYIVEIDPTNLTAKPKKRTALGRFKHENAEVVIADNGKIVVYMGDDERGEFLYRYVSNQPYIEGSDTSSLLDDGKLYVAKFSDDQTGEWMELSPATTGMSSQAEICVHTRIAASALGATTMDRPEWVTAHPTKSEVYCALTNNKNRGIKPNAGGDPTPVGGPNPREANNYGQIVRWMPFGGDHTASGFNWNLFVLAGNPTVYADERKGSRNINAGNMFNSPDGLGFDSKGFLWIQTDGNYSNDDNFEGMGNNQMLVGNTDSGEIRRFLVGPKECEITGITWSTDRKTLFVGVQHPGEDGNSHFPDGGTTVPRSAVIAISHDDGNEIG